MDISDICLKDFFVSVLKMKIRSLGTASKVCPKRNLYAQFPIPKSIFLSIFPQAIQLKKNDDQISLKGKHISRLYTTCFSSVKDLEQLLGKNWFLINCGSNIGVYIGKTRFSLVQHTTTEFISNFVSDEFIIDKQSIKREIFYELHISVMFTKFSRAFKSPEFIQKEIAELINKKYQRRIKLK